MEYVTRLKDKKSQYKMDYSKKTVTELRTIAEQSGMDGYFTRQRKAELIAKIDVHNTPSIALNVSLIDERPCEPIVVNRRHNGNSFPCDERPYDERPYEIIAVIRRRNGNSSPCDASLIDDDERPCMYIVVTHLRNGTPRKFVLLCGPNDRPLQVGCKKTIMYEEINTIL
jgi:hypothetical protein